ncbi:MAG: heparinase II/III family protein [Bacteroidales bacterium]|nr:heparinase II/III family protein [Bacteroidales bacterium]
MRTCRFVPGLVLLILAFQMVSYQTSFAQNQQTDQEILVAPLPELLKSQDGVPIESAEQWEKIRRVELLELFREHMYGRVPETSVTINHHLKFCDWEALNGTAILKEVEMEVIRNSDTLDITLLIFLPKNQPGPVPLFLGLNFNGNHTVHSDPRISVTASWVGNNRDLGISDNRSTEAARGASAKRWEIELILSRGYGLATMYYGDIDPDYDDGFKNGIHALMDEDREPDSWSSIAAWAWGLSRAMDYFEEDADIDQKRVAVMGHSRLGKTSLWAGAQDERFAMVISNNSGCGGAALSRRAQGETVSLINNGRPHWFAARFSDYNDKEAELPVDQHMLMALMAPRPLYVASAEEDDWADQPGEFLSLYHGSQAYKLYGEEALSDKSMPELNQPVKAGRVGYHIRTGKHDVTCFDWEQYLDFADQHLLAPEGNGFENMVTREWIDERLFSTSPRLILTPELEYRIWKQLDSGDTLVAGGMRLLLQNAEAMLELDPLVRQQTGRRLLGVSREAIRRLTTLALAYRFERDQRYLDRLEEELKAVCSFSDWNPSHFLDVAEMAAGVALAIDWAGEWLSPEVNQQARYALVNKALKKGLASSGDNWWITTDNNWNLVCHGGLSLAALAVYEDEPALASAILHQAVEHIPLAIKPYAPDGIYPEGASYWFYATTYLTAAISAYESALGTDFGLAMAPGVMESAIFSQVLAGPSREYFNYFDSGLGGFQSVTHFGLLSWFAYRSGDGLDWNSYASVLEAELNASIPRKGPRFFPAHFLNLAKLERENGEEFKWPETWSGGGEEPIVVMRDRFNIDEAFFLAAKGGRAADNHGNMDAGSFVFELDGVRWSVDPGNQDYNTLEQLMGGALWNRAQDSRRWSLLTKNSFGHSTLTVNGEMHLADARATLVRCEMRGARPEFIFDLSGLFGDNLQSAKRTFTRLSDTRLGIRDEVVFSPETLTLTWQMMTRAEVKIEKDRIELEQEGATLYLTIPGVTPFEVNVVSLSPPPLSFDKDIQGLKRLEIQWKSEDFTGKAATLFIELDSKEP